MHATFDDDPIEDELQRLRAENRNLQDSWRRLNAVFTSDPSKRTPMDDNDVLVGCEQRGIHVWGERSEDFEAGVRFAERFHSIKENGK